MRYINLPFYLIIYLFIWNTEYVSTLTEDGNLFLQQTGKSLAVPRRLFLAFFSITWFSIVRCLPTCPTPWTEENYHGVSPSWLKVDGHWAMTWTRLLCHRVACIVTRCSGRGCMARYASCGGPLSWNNNSTHRLPRNCPTVWSSHAPETAPSPMLSSSASCCLRNHHFPLSIPSRSAVIANYRNA